MGYIAVFGYRGVEFLVRDDHFFTFTNSPYYSHRVLSAIDIYPPIDSDGAVASPFNGKLIYHKVVGGEHVAGFAVEDFYVRTLHIEPAVKVGETVSIGDQLGVCRHSPTFFPWTDPHAHIEVRDDPEFLRARGGQRLAIGSGLRKVVEEKPPKNGLGMAGSIAGIIHIVRKGKYLLIKPLNRSTGVSPLTATVGNAPGYLDGGLPHYGHGGVLTERVGKVFSADVQLTGKPIGKVKEVIGNYVHFITHRFAPLINEVSLTGVSVYLNFPYIKVIPRRWETLNLREGDHAELRISPPSNPRLNT